MYTSFLTCFLLRSNEKVLACGTWYPTLLDRISMPALAPCTPAVTVPCFSSALRVAASMVPSLWGNPVLLWFSWGCLEGLQREHPDGRLWDSRWVTRQLGTFSFLCTSLGEWKSTGPCMPFSAAPAGHTSCSWKQRDTKTGALERKPLEKT